jgi:hypothetical protein
MTDMTTKTIGFGLDIDETEFDVSVTLWADGMATTLASFDGKNYEPVLVTTAGPTTTEIEEAIIQAFCT